MCNTIVFSKSGKHNTENVFQVINDYSSKKQISKVVVSSTTGYTAFKAEEIIEFYTTLVICKQDISDEYCMRQNIYEQLSSRHIVLDIPRQYLQKKSGSEVTNFLRKISQGIKVCFELTEYLIEHDIVTDGEQIVVVAGTLKGADTAVVVRIGKKQQYILKQILCLPAND